MCIPSDLTGGDCRWTEGRSTPTFKKYYSVLLFISKSIRNLNIRALQQICFPSIQAMATVYFHTRAGESKCHRVWSKWFIQKEITHTYTYIRCLPFVSNNDCTASFIVDCILVCAYVVGTILYKHCVKFYIIITQ